MARTVTHASVSGARRKLKVLLDAADHGAPAFLHRGKARFAVVDAEQLRLALTRLIPAAEVVAENDGWTIILPGTPLAADGANLEAAVANMLDAMRDYAADWIERLWRFTNHAGNWAVVQLIELSTDDQLADWLTAVQLTAARRASRANTRRPPALLGRRGLGGRACPRPRSP